MSWHNSHFFYMAIGSNPSLPHELIPAINSYHLLRAFYVPMATLSDLHVLLHLTIIMTSKR